MGARYLLTVRFLKTNSGKKGEGMPVVRNPQFYFREPFSCTTYANIGKSNLHCMAIEVAEPLGRNPRKK